MKKNNLIMNSTILSCESGRSMVEILGVLAVIGVLSVAGIAGYSNAMNKHRANELMNEASKRAVILQAQLAMGRSADQLSLSEFTNNNLGYGTFQTDVIEGEDGKTFGIKVSGVPEGVCKQLANMSGGRVQVKKQGALTSEFTAANCAPSADSNALAFVFGDRELTNSGNTDNPDTNDSGSNDSPNVGPCDSFDGTSLTGEGGFVPGYSCACEEQGTGWDGSSCQPGYDDSDDGSGSDSGSGSGSGSGAEDNDLGACASNADCANVTGCENGVCFCNYKGNVSCTDGPSGQAGKCQVRQFGRLPSGATSEGFFRSKGGLDWYSAQNFCASYNNGEMVHLSDIGVGTNAGQYLTVVSEWQETCYGNVSCGLTDESGTGGLSADQKSLFGSTYLTLECGVGIY